MVMTIGWDGDDILMLDQRILPGKTDFLRLRSTAQVIESIKKMVIRGAPAIGCAAAMGLALGGAKIRVKTRSAWEKKFAELSTAMAQARPTAVNLVWAVNRMNKLVADNPDASVDQLKDMLRLESEKVLAEDIEINKAMGRVGAEFIPDGATVLTHCNAGALATGGYGTALGVIRAAVEAGKKINVLADETRPWLQGARLTAWELKEDNIPVKVITDNMAGALMAQGVIDCAVVGADRIAINGDVANKIGTYSVAVLADVHDIPFYVAAPTSTVDPNTPSGEKIPIEQRNSREVTHIGNKQITPDGVEVLHPAFDVTPARLVKAIFTEKGASQNPHEPNLRRMLGV